jgi:hypothetical protein
MPAPNDSADGPPTEIFSDFSILPVTNGHFSRRLGGEALRAAWAHPMPTTDTHDDGPAQRRSPPTHPPGPRRPRQAPVHPLRLRTPALVALDTSHEHAALCALAVLLADDADPDQPTISEVNEL